MGAVLAVCGESFCAMVSDGRMVEEPVQGKTPRVISEDVPQVRKLNGNVLVGFAGDTLAAVQIVNAVDEYDLRYLTLEKTVKVLQAKAGAVACQPVGVQLLVGGRGRKGGFELAALGSADDFTPEYQPARPGAYLIEGACAHTPIAPMLALHVRPAAEGWRSLDDIAKTLDACIAAIARDDASVNTHIFRELIL